jgi:hypothetical protein
MNQRRTPCSNRTAAWLIGALLSAGCSSAPVVAASTDAGTMDAGDVAPTCGAAQVLCNGACINAQTDNANCGACGRACSAGQVCSLGVCATSCAAPLTTCATTGDAGSTASCADLANDRLNCGACGAACPPGNICVNRSCQVSCAAGQTQCGGACVDLRTSNAHCGACGNACAPGTACAAGVCAISCGAGLTQCATSCVNLQSDNANCGTCGAQCPAGQVCARGACSTTCAAPLVSCSIASGSFCANTSVDPAHCGACGNACSLPGAAASGCVAGGCTVARCNASLGDCDGAAANGCEADLATSSANCGACGRACVLPNATSACSGGACSVTACAAGFLDCDLSAANGCEVRSQSDNANCGACNRACPAGQVCSAGACATTCAAPLSLCGGGCVNTANDPTHCGSCPVSCSAGANATAVCAAGACAFVCAAGFADCDRNPANGCEVNLATSVASCGACGLACPARPGAASVCAAGACGFLCGSGTADCDGNAANGCEVSTTSVSNCGGCGVVCPVRPGTTAACVAGACISPCSPGFADCDGDPSNGCSSLQTDPLNCGGCGVVCPAGRACTAGACLNATSCRSIKQTNPSAASGVYLIDPDGAGSGAPFNVYCEMSTDGGGWTVMAYIRSNAQWDIATFADSGTVGNTAGGFAQGATLAASAATFTERILIYRRLIEQGADLGTQWMVTYRQDGVATRYSGFNVSSGWAYRDSFGYADPTVNNACSHGCGTFRTLGMFHDSEAGFGYAGTQGGDYGCVDGNNICWVQRSLGCNVGSQRCSLLTGTNEGVIYAGR